ncbi:TIGR02099 family protein [Onishia taeanensis]|uniref:TIGR02099 family protein n=1 Tax=Onishia taeanensis TaxID=284577 RepID=A0A1G7R9T2_9GAMM|nr:AsmA-like C-terminal region-containing protein [Halomonas taeanensis]SDG07405.1 TIGR02099 family protein [Halomonas taeanensis]
MSPFRLLSRWALTIVAVLLALLAVLLLTLRLAASELDRLRPEVESLLSDRFNAELKMEQLSGGFHGLDPSLSLGQLTLASRTEPARPLLEIDSAHLRLDGIATLLGMPQVDDAKIRGVTLHLYQNPDRSWHWPQPAELPPEIIPDGSFTLERLDYWVGVLLRQRLAVENVRVVLHGLDRRLAFEAPRLLMAGDAGRAHIEGQLHVANNPDATLTAVLEVLPGQGGLADFNAALQARMELDQLVELAGVLSRNEPLKVDEAQGEARLWGRWHHGALEDVRLDVDVPRLLLSHEQQPLDLQDIRVTGQWLRGDEGWQAWLNTRGDSETDVTTTDAGAPAEQDATPDEAAQGAGTGSGAEEGASETLSGKPDAAGRPLPRHWQASGDANGWWLKTSRFDLAALAAWRDRVPLPDGLQRVLGRLAPRGQVGGLEVGHRDGHWRAVVALYDVAVDPWQGAPGGGPLDAWVEAEDLSGSVRFADTGDAPTALNFPDIFAAPMALSSASGKVSWVYQDKGVSVTGRDLAVKWRGAPVTGSFDLEAGRTAPGDLALDLAFTDVDASRIDLLDWLPVKALPAELTEWLGLGVAGIVDDGSLSLNLPLADDLHTEDVDLSLALDIRDGTLPFAPGWPALEGVEGQLRLDNQRLSADVEKASLVGLEARDATVSLNDEQLEVSSQAEGSTTALLDFLAAIPDLDIGREDWSGQGSLAGKVDLAMDLGAPDALSLDVSASVDEPRLGLAPAGLNVFNVNGDVTYRYRDRQGGLYGELGARAFEGPLLADFDGDAQSMTLTGRALARGLLEWAGTPDLAPLVSGYFPYTLRMPINGEKPTVTLDSRLEGLAVNLPPPFGKRAGEAVPLTLNFDQARERGEMVLRDRARLRWRNAPSGTQGQVWLENWPLEPSWPRGPGWSLQWQTNRLPISPWVDALSGLSLQHLSGRQGGSQRAAADSLATIGLSTACLSLNNHCLGTLQANADSLGGGNWHMTLDGSIAKGEADYRPAAARTVNVDLTRLSLDGLWPAPEAPTQVFDEVAVEPEPLPLPGWIDAVPDGRLRVAEMTRLGSTLGPLNLNWQASPSQLVLAPLGLTLGQVTARGELIWEAAGSDSSLTRSRLRLDGGDLGTALAALGQDVPIRNAETHVESQLAWPGAPWQFALVRSRGSLDVNLLDGRFLNLQSGSAKLIGLLNFDNLLRRLRLDFSDVTGQGTAFDRVNGSATLYGGILETHGPVQIDAPATQFSLEGQVDLARRELDQRLAITVPVSQALPVAALVAGGPVIGGAVFLAQRLFGRAIDRVTRIHYRVQGPWTDPRISLESAE